MTFSISDYNGYALCLARSNTASMAALIRENKQSPRPGLSDEAYVNGLVQEEKYACVLKCIWGEGDKEKRLTWLRKHSWRNIPILMCEQAIAEFVVKPGLETIQNLSLPLIYRAKWETKHELAYFKGACRLKIDQGLSDIYHAALKKAVNKYFGNAVFFLRDIDFKLYPEKENQLLMDLAQKFFDGSKNVASSRWIESYASHIRMEKVSLCSERERLERRNIVARTLEGACSNSVDLELIEHKLDRVVTSFD